MKIVCLGNEFVEEDCFAKEVGGLLGRDYEVVNIRDSFQLMEVLASQEDAGGRWAPVGHDSGEPQDVGGIVLLDVVEGLDEVRELRVEDLRVDSILSAHDFDVGQVLALFGHDSGEPGLLDVDVRIVGIPMSGDLKSVAEEVLELVFNEKL